MRSQILTWRATSRTCPKPEGNAPPKTPLPHSKKEKEKEVGTLWRFGVAWQQFFWLVFSLHWVPSIPSIARGRGRTRGWSCREERSSHQESLPPGDLGPDSRVAPPRDWHAMPPSGYAEPDPGGYPGPLWNLLWEGCESLALLDAL